MQLSEEEARVLGSIVEKAMTTPQQYPLTITALVAACNQSSNRDPVVNYDERTVMLAIGVLKEKRLVRSVLPSHGRTAVRYRHVLDETLGLDPARCALLAVLLLRGAQTVGELRLRTERMAEFDGLSQVEHELGYLASLPEPLAANSGRRPGQKEERWTCPCVSPSATPPASPYTVDVQSFEPGEHEPEPGPAPGYQTTSPPTPAPVGGVAAPGPQSQLGELAAAVTALRSEVDDLRRQLEALRSSLGG